MVASRLALDTRRVTITFDSGKEFDRQQIARLYRVARVISHVATNGHVVIEADVPRRFIERLTAVELAVKRQYENAQLIDLWGASLWLASLVCAGLRHAR